MRRSTLFWGAVLVIVGMALLLDNLGLLGGIRVWDLLWPTFLILLGIWIFLGQFFRRSVRQEHAAVALEGAQRARVILRHGAGRLNVASGADAVNILQGDFAGGVDIQKHREGDALVARLSVPQTFFPPWDFMGGALNWEILLNREIPMLMELESGANESRLDLSEARVTELRLKSGASSTTVTLPSGAGYTRVDIEAGAASVDIRVPDGVAARVRSRSGISTINVNEQRFPHLGEDYQSVDYDSAANRVEIDVKMGAGSVTIH